MSEVFAKFLVAVFWLFLLVAGLVLIGKGYAGIRDRSLDYSWGPKHSEVRFTEHYRGVEAVREGSAYVAFGSVFLLIAAILVGTPLLRRWELTPTAVFLKRITVWSLATAYFAALGLFFPPWRIQSTPFYVVPVGVALVWLVNRSPRVRASAAASVFVCGIVLAVFAGALGNTKTAQAWGAKLALGVLAAFIGAVILLSLRLVSLPMCKQRVMLDEMTRDEVRDAEA